MSKAERLFSLVNLLRGRRGAVTASNLAANLGVTERTIYRDIAGLAAAGVAVDGERGVGFRLPRSSHLPPLMFEPDEAEAIAVGLRLVRALTDPQLADAAAAAERRMRAVLPEAAKRRLETLPYRVPVLEKTRALRERHALLRGAAAAQLKIRLGYTDGSGAASERTIWPLGLIGMGEHWIILAWCEVRSAYRNFRIDRMSRVELLPDRFVVSDTISIAHYFGTVLGINDADR